MDAEAAILGDDFERLYRRCYPLVLAYCRRRLAPDEAAEVAADVFVLAWRKFDSVPDGDAAHVWLYAAAYRLIGNRWRTLRRRRALDLKAWGLRIPHSEPADVLIVRMAESDEVMRAFSRLGPAEQEILRLSVWEELTASQIGEVMGITSHAAEKRLQRARRRLADRLESTRSLSRALEKGGEG